MSQHPVTDEGRRLSAAVDVARAAGGEGRWIAARLSDGDTDGNVYDAKADAVRHQIDETLCAYLVIPPAPMPPAEATAWLALHRRMYDAGFRLQDPTGATPIPPLQAYNHLQAAQRIVNDPQSRRARRLADRARNRNRRSHD